MEMYCSNIVVVEIVIYINIGMEVDFNTCQTIALTFQLCGCLKSFYLLLLQVYRVPEDFPVSQSASEPHDETQRHQTVHLQ